MNDPKLPETAGRSELPLSSQVVSLDDTSVYAASGPRHWQVTTTGPLKDKRLVIKDLFSVAGFHTGAGNPDWLSSHDAATHTAVAVEQLMNAGCYCLARTQTDELAYSLNGINAHFGVASNPVAEGRLAGGSSSGSVVAVARGDADIGLGTDTGGSIRVPASYCGVFGFRPSHGLISTDGLVALAPPFDTVGWLCRDAATLRQTGNVLLPEQSLSSFSKVRVLLPEFIDQAVLNSVTSLLSDDAEPEVTPLRADYLAELSQAFRVLQGRAIWQTHGEWITQQKPHFAPDVASRFQWSSTLTQEDEEQASQIRATFLEVFNTWTQGNALLVLPTTPGASPRKDLPAPALAAYREQLMGMTALAGLAGAPQLSMPVMQSEGCPWGLSLMARPGDDRSLLALAESLNFSTGAFLHG
ncbi:amidase [Pokkaliibacter sp. CJK22405]|uniref:amidase n=1 Tax=Pokkaliibacter sp. CJK22405 TaxID=3384615 RepID=UPI003984713C